jgi:hypothetical protein
MAVLLVYSFSRRFRSCRNRTRQKRRWWLDFGDCGHVSFRIARVKISLTIRIPMGDLNADLRQASLDFMGKLLVPNAPIEVHAVDLTGMMERLTAQDRAEEPESTSSG